MELQSDCWRENRSRRKRSKCKKVLERGGVIGKDGAKADEIMVIAVKMEKRIGFELANGSSVIEGRTSDKRPGN